MTLTEGLERQPIEERRIALDEMGDVTVSTVFTNHNMYDADDPQWFETMVFGGPLNDEQARYATVEEARAGHAAMVERVKAAREGQAIPQPSEGDTTD